MDHDWHHLRKTVRPRNAAHKTGGGEQRLQNYGRHTQGNRRDNLGTPESPTTADATAKGYIDALEEKAEMQDAHIEELMARNTPETAPATDATAATSTITGGTSRSSKTSTQITDLQSSLAAIMETVATQEMAMTALTKQVAEGANRRGDSRRNNDRRGGGRRDEDNKDKTPAEKQTGTKCKLQVWHKEENCPEYARNDHKRWSGWKSVLK